MRKPGTWIGFIVASVRVSAFAAVSAAECRPRLAPNAIPTGRARTDAPLAVRIDRDVQRIADLGRVHAQHGLLEVRWWTAENCSRDRRRVTDADGVVAAALHDLARDVAEEKRRPHCAVLSPTSPTTAAYV
jgi:hypothetical protein